MNNKKVLIVDDEPLNRETLEEDLQDEGYETFSAENGEKALEVLESDTEIDVILLDRMMPKMDGMEVLKRIKKIPRLSDIPVIMQTAAKESHEIIEGVKAGVYYYLAKPFDSELMLGVVESAVKSRNRKNDLLKDMKQQTLSLALMETGTFRFKSTAEVNDLSSLLANAFPDPGRVINGISELMLNAVEHGNLGLTNAEKNDHMINGTWRAALDERMADEKLSKRTAVVTFQKNSVEAILTIEDEGEGFEWDEFLDISPERALSPNGRGIAMARMLSFDQLEFKGKGNIVEVRVTLQK